MMSGLSQTCSYEVKFVLHMYMLCLELLRVRVPNWEE